MTSTEQPYDDAWPTKAEFLVLDIGGDVGALIVHADESCLGREVDVTPVGQPRSHHLHTMIRRRRAPNREFVAGVYVELIEGTYTVWGLDGRALGQVQIKGGSVTEFQAGDCHAGVAPPHEHDHPHPHRHDIIPAGV